MDTTKVAFSIPDDVLATYKGKCDVLMIAPTNAVILFMKAFTSGELKYFDGKLVGAPTQVSAGQTGSFASTTPIKKKEEEQVSIALVALRAGIAEFTAKDMRAAGRTDKQIMEYGEICKLQQKEMAAQQDVEEAAEEAAEKAAEREVEKIRKNQFLVK